MPVFLECRRCTACCRWPGQVAISESEISRIAEFLNLSEHAFIQEFTRINAARNGLALTEKSDGSCMFLDGNECHIQAVKPQQCRDFPNLWQFPGFEKLCQAIPRILSETEYRDKIRTATGRKSLT